MKNFKHGRTIHRDMRQEAPVGFRELLPTVIDAIEDVNLLACDAWHDKSSDWTTSPVMKRRHRPRGKARQLLRGMGCHVSQLFGTIGRGRLVIELRDSVSLPKDFVYRPFATGSQLAAEF